MKMKNHLEIVQLSIAQASIPIVITEDENPLQCSHTSRFQRLRFLVKERSGRVQYSFLSVIKHFGYLLHNRQIRVTPLNFVLALRILHMMKEELRALGRAFTFRN